jgi:hypothetical protein
MQDTMVIVSVPAGDRCIEVPVALPPRCGCGAVALYKCGNYDLCDDCSWALAEAGGAP